MQETKPGVHQDMERSPAELHLEWKSLQCTKLHQESGYNFVSHQKL